MVAQCYESKEQCELSTLNIAGATVQETQDRVQCEISSLKVPNANVQDQTCKNGSRICDNWITGKDKVAAPDFARKYSLLEEWYKSDDTQETLYAEGAADELMHHWATQETRSFTVPKSAATPVRALPQHTRTLAMRALTQFVRLDLPDLPPKTFFEAAMLFDMFMARSTDPDPVYMLPVTCGAIVSILQKTECATELYDMAPYASRLCKHMLATGYNVVSDVTTEMVDNHEKTILEVLEWRIIVPTVEKWISMFTARINVLTCHAFYNQLLWVWNASAAMAYGITTAQALGQHLPPKSLAVGLICMNLISAGVFPSEALRPPKFTSEDWATLCAAVRPQMPQVQLGPSDVAASTSLLLLLSTVFGISLGEVRDLCRVATLTAQRLLPATPSMTERSSTVHHASI